MPIEVEVPKLRPIDLGTMNPPLNTVLVANEQGLSQLEGYLKRVKETGFDVETTVTDSFYHRKLRTLQFGDRNEQYVVDLLKFARSPEDLESQQGHYGKNLGSLRPVVDALKPFLEDHAFTKVGHGMQFEFETLRWCWGLRSTGFFDLLLAEKIIHAGTTHYMMPGFWSLADVVARYLGLEMDKSYQTSFNMQDPDLTEGQVAYCALDVRLPMAIKPTIVRQFEQHGLSKAAEVEFDTISAFGEMYLNGVTVSKPRWDTRIEQDKKKLQVCIDRLDDFFLPVLGNKEKPEEEKQELLKREATWRDSPKKTLEDRAERALLKAAYFELKKLDTVRRNLASDCEGNALINYGSKAQLKVALLKLGFKAKDLPNTADETLEKLSKNPKLTVKSAFEKDPELKSFSVIDVIRLYRSISKALDTYGYAWITDHNHTLKGKACPGHVDPDTGAIHSRIHQIGAATGRTSSTAPNVQNVPADKEYRSCFVAPEGRKMLTLDFNSCELRILAELSQEPVWLDAFGNGWDLHSVIAELVFGEAWKNGAEDGCHYYAEKKKCECKVHKELRDRRVKIINFSIAYGKSARGLAEDMGIKFEEAEDILNRWRKVNPTVAAYLDQAGANAVTSLMVRTLSGRWRKWNRPTWDGAKHLVEKELKAGQQSTQELVRRKYTSLFRSIDREGKNASIQGTNADIAKLAMYYIWRDGEPYGIKQHNMVHDENVLSAPEDQAEAAREFASDCMEKAGAEFVKSLRMTAGWHIADCWTK